MVSPSLASCGSEPLGLRGEARIKAELPKATNDVGSFGDGKDDAEIAQSCAYQLQQPWSPTAGACKSIPSSQDQSSIGKCVFWSIFSHTYTREPQGIVLLTSQSSISQRVQVPL